MQDSASIGPFEAGKILMHEHEHTSTVESDGLLQLNHFSYIALSFRISIFFVGLVECCDVCVVVL